MEIVILNSNPNQYYRKIWERASDIYSFKIRFEDNFILEKSKEDNLLILSDDWVCCGGAFNRIQNDIVLFKTSFGVFDDLIYITKNHLTCEIFKGLINLKTLKDYIKALSQKNLPFLSYDFSSCEVFQYTGPQKIFLSNISNISKELREFLFKTIYKSLFSELPPSSVVHGGDLGDIIYSIAGFKELGLKKIILKPHGFYETKMSEKTALSLKPFLEKQGFYVEVKKNIDIDDADIFLDFFREGVRDMENNHLSITNFEKIFIKPNISNLELDVEPLDVAEVVISRTERYRNTIFDYRYLIDGLDEDIKVCFVGTKEEYERFVKIYPLRSRVFYYPTSNFLELASVIKGCKVFIGNQSSPYALAEVLKVPRIQETSHLTPNCRGTTENSIDVLTQDDLYSAKNFLFRTLGINKKVDKPKKKTLLFSLSEIKTVEDYEALVLWVDWHLKINKEIDFFDNLVILDNTSEHVFLSYFKQVYPLSHVEKISLDEKGYVFPCILKEKEISLLSFKEKIITNSSNIVADFWRGYLIGISVADVMGYEKAIYLSSNSFIFSNRIALWAKNTNVFSCLYDQKGRIMTSFQIIPKNKFSYFTNLLLLNEKINYDFIYGHSLDKYHYLPQYFLKFENSADEFKNFIIKKYKLNSRENIPQNIDLIELEKNYFEGNPIKIKDIEMKMLSNINLFNLKYSEALNE
ncbi:MAG: hypothetical protein N2446_01855 [Elusimicrobiales bacterium]|nr:hypothetical protein [Elusimicrobiales bacterium]